MHGVKNFELRPGTRETWADEKQVQRPYSVMVMFYISVLGFKE